MVEATTTLQLVLPQDIVMDSALSFLELPSYTFEGEDDEEEDSDDYDEMDGLPRNSKLWVWKDWQMRINT